MVRAADFGPGKTALWALKMKWRTDILAYGALCATVSMTESGTQAREDAQLQCGKALLARARRALRRPWRTWRRAGSAP